LNEFFSAISEKFTLPSRKLTMSHSYTEPTEVPTASPEELKYGEREIEDGQLITFPNPRVGRRYQVEITLPEFTCKCPFSGYPDFATIYLTYLPDERVVELKSIKLYINSYRDRYISHEESINQILDDFVAAADPLEVRIKGDFNPRGNVHTVVEVEYQKPNPKL
jgi:7-cyano-7-deazaguanine reductase